MIVVNNVIQSITRDIQTAIIHGHNLFPNVNSVSVVTIDWIVKRHQMRMKPLYGGILTELRR